MLSRFPFILLLLITLILVCIFQSCIFSRIDRTPYQEASFYQQWNEQLDHLDLHGGAGPEDTIRVGWAKANITPEKPVSLAGYGARRGKKYTAVNDSIWTRTFVFDNGRTKAALVSLDLLIVPPVLTEELARQLPSIGYTIDQVYLTATHSHNSIGGWAEKLVGRLIAGKYRSRVVKQLAGQIIASIRQAEDQTEPARIGTAQLYAGEWVRHRIEETGSTDPWLRVMKIERNSGETAVLTTFAAHATCLPMDNYTLSRDYPGALVDSLEKHPDIDFAAFSAGGVGSHRPGGNVGGIELIGALAKGLSRKITNQWDSIPLAYQTELASVQVPLPLNKPQWRISENNRLRPWVFYALYGDYPSSITALKVGNTTWLGAPCDFSGELIPQVQADTTLRNQFLMVTSFNGGYIGYVTHDRYYDVKHYETRAMNWFGPGNGAYLAEAMRGLAKRMENL